MSSLHLRDGVTEGTDYEILPDLLFSYIYQIYGGTDIRRLTVCKAQAQVMASKMSIAEDLPIDVLSEASESTVNISQISALD